MKMLRSKKGFTLLEVIISIAMIAAVALPLLSIFVQSVKTDRAANDVLNANYISQDYIERLDAQTYESALNSLPNFETVGDYHLSASITPYGTTNGMFDTACDYVHMVCYDNEKLLVVLPDGKWHMFSSVPNGMAFLTSGNSYALLANDFTFVSGTISHTKCAIIINAMKKTSSSTSTIAYSDNCKAVLYCRATATSDITMTGASETYPDMITGDTSLVHITASVYEDVTASDPIATSESYINIRNW